MAQGKVVAFLRSLPGQAASNLYWLPGQLIANSKLYRPDDPLQKKFEFFFRRKAIWEMAALSATICGIEFCYSAETAFVSPLLRLLGTPTYFTSMVWGCSPILGVFVTPVFGSLSDACNSRFGRRRPFIVALSLIVLLGLTLIGSAVSIAQKTEAEIMAKYENVSGSTTRLPLMKPGDAIAASLMDDYGGDDEEEEELKDRHSAGKFRKKREVTMGPIFFPAFTTRRRKTTTLPTTSTSTEASTTPWHLRPKNGTSKEASYEDEEEFTTTTKRRRSTTTTTRLYPTTYDPLRNLEAALGEGYSGATTETPPTAAALHGLPIGMAILGVILMDFGCDASQSPCRTYLLDVCLPEDHRLGLRTFTVSAGLGGTIGYLMGGIDMGGSAYDTAAVFFQHLKVVYTVIGILFVIFVCSTIFVFQEPTLEEWRDLQALANESQEAARQEMEKLRAQGSKPSMRKLNRQMSRKLQSGLALKAQPKQPERLPLMATRSCSDAMQQFKIQSEAADITREESQQSVGQAYGTQGANDVCRTKSMDKTELDRMNAPKEIDELDCLASDEDTDEDYAFEDAELDAFTHELVANEPKEPTFLTYLRSIRHMPKSVGLVCLTNYFSWMSLVCYSLYFTDFCGEIVYDGEATAPYGTPLRLTYEAGVRFGACGMSLYSLTCCIYSLFAEKIYKKIGLRFTYALGPTLYSLGLITLVLVQAKWAAIFLSLTAGLMYSTLFTMPYILIGKYHSAQMFEKIPDNLQDPERQQLQGQMSNNEQGSYNQIPGSNGQQNVPKPGEVRGLGTDIALVSSMVFLAQFTVALTAGPLSHATDSPIAVLVIGSVAAATTAILSLKLYYPSKA